MCVMLFMPVCECRSLTVCVCVCRLSEMQEELLSMAVSKRKLETQREELVSRLQGMMRSHWAEALRLLTNQEQV